MYTHTYTQCKHAHTYMYTHPHTHIHTHFLTEIYCNLLTSHLVFGFQFYRVCLSGEFSVNLEAEDMY